jgi:hypothetical protein
MVFLTAFLQIWEEFKIIIAEELQLDHRYLKAILRKFLSALLRTLLRKT